MTELTTKKLDQIARIKGGIRLPKGKQLTTEGTNHPYIRAQDIRNNRIVLTEPNYVTEDIFEKIKRYTVSQDDVVLTIVGAGIGEIGIIPKNLDGANLTENAVKLTDLKEFDPQFLFYSLLDEQAQGQIYNLAAGAAQPKLGIYKVKQIEVPAPSLESQQKIASILSAFDDLIENNTRRIAILEEMAQLIYREWFVQYRYPGHENDRLVDSGTELGEVPEGWEVEELQEVAKIERGKSYRSKNLLVEGGLPFVNLKCFERGGGFRKSGLKNFEGDFKNKHKVSKGDIVIAVTDMTQARDIIARAAMVPDLGQEYGVMSMDVVKLVPKSIDSFFFIHNCAILHFLMRLKIMQTEQTYYI